MAHYDGLGQVEAVHQAPDRGNVLVEHVTARYRVGVAEPGQIDRNDAAAAGHRGQTPQPELPGSALAVDEDHRRTRADVDIADAATAHDQVLRVPSPVDALPRFVKRRSRHGPPAPL